MGDYLKSAMLLMVLKQFSNISDIVRNKEVLGYILTRELLLFNRKKLREIRSDVA